MSSFRHSGRNPSSSSSSMLESLERRAMLSASPAGAGVAAAAGRDQMVLEAEQAALTGAVIASQHAGYTGAGYVDFTKDANEAVTFIVKAPQAGNYTLEIRFANGSAAARKLGLLVNGQTPAGDVTFGSTGSWSTWQAVAVSVPLRAGTNSITLVAIGQSAPNIDSLTVRPNDPMPGKQTYQAEAPAVKKAGAVLSTAHQGYTGEGYLDFVNAAGDYAEFTITVTKGGHYALDFRYANGAGHRTMGLVIDGKAVAGGIGFGSTGSWSTWNVAGKTVQLTAGTHTVRLVATGQSGPNIDSLVTEGVNFPALASARAAAPGANVPAAPSAAPSQAASLFADAPIEESKLIA